MVYRPVYISTRLKSMTTHNEYASRNASFSDYADEKVDVSYFSDKDEESKLPKVFIRPILLYKDLNFSVGKQILDGVEFPETILINGLEYALVNYGEQEISYLKADAMDKPVYTLISRTIRVMNGVYLYCYPQTPRYI